MEIKRLILLTFTILSISLASLCQCQFSGPWHGNLNIQGQKLPLVINIEESGVGLSATLDSPAQEAKGIPAEISIDGKDIIVTVAAIGATYTGTYTGETFKGTFKQSGMTFALELKAGEYVANRPQTPEGPFPYETYDVKIINPVDSATLAATVALPILYHMPKHKEYPVVVMVTGSGQQNRDEEIAGHKPFAVIAHHLAQNGIITVRYDDRGFAKSTGDIDGATSVTFASDAKAVVDYARANIEKAGKVGVLGHSEGGTIAFMLAADGVVDFVVSLAGPAIGGDSILVLQNYQLLRQADEQIAEDYAKAFSRLMEFEKANPEAKEWPDIDKETYDLQHLTPALKQNLQKVIQTRNAWIDYFINYDPTADIERITVPVMALNGSLDMQVDAEANLSALKAHLPENEKTLINEYPGLNHLFQHATTGMPNEYATIEETISPEVLSDITKWLKSLTRNTK